MEEREDSLCFGSGTPPPAKPENPSAFPSTTHGAEGHLVNGPEFGMSLRDYFAAKAMQADLTYQGLEGREDVQHAAAMAYEMADAMLKARRSQP